MYYQSIKQHISFLRWTSFPWIGFGWLMSTSSGITWFVTSSNKLACLMSAPLHNKYLYISFSKLVTVILVTDRLYFIYNSWLSGSKHTETAPLNFKSSFINYSYFGQMSRFLNLFQTNYSAIQCKSPTLQLTWS